MAYVAIFAIFGDWGMSAYAVREMARDRASTSWLLPNIVVMRLILSLVVVLIAPLSALWLGKERGVVLGILIASAGQFLYAFQGPLETVLTAYERLDYTSAFSLINQLVFWGLGVLFLVNGLGVTGLIVASMAGVGVAALLSGRALLKMGIGRMILAVRRWPRLVAASLPFGISGISYVLAQRFDTVVMSFVLTDAAVGWYSVPLTLVNMMLLIAQSIAVAMFPSMVRNHGEDPSSLQNVVWQSFRYLLIICLPVVVGGTILADRIIIAFCGPEFANSIPVFRMILWALPSLFLLELLGRVACTFGLERPAAQIDVISAVLTVVVNLILVPPLGIMGAALALLSSRALRLVLYWELIGNDRLVGRQWMSLLRVVLAGFAMGIVVFFLARIPALARADPKAGLLTLLVAGVIVYPLALAVSGAVERREMVLLRRMAAEQLGRNRTERAR